MSPKAAWEQVPYRDWLIAGLAVNLVGQQQEFTAISEPVLVTFDLLGSEIKPEMRTASERIKKIVESDTHQRAFMTTITFGLSRQASAGKDAAHPGLPPFSRTGKRPVKASSESRNSFPKSATWSNTQIKRSSSCTYTTLFCFAVFEEGDNFSVIMKNTMKLSVVLVPLLMSLVIVAQAPQPAAPRPFTPVTQKMLENPSPEDWLMFSRTYDAQRYSPLKQINKQNVGQLKMVFTLDMPAGSTETIPLVHDGVMYATLPSGAVRALDAATGATMWEYKRPGNGGRSKTLGIFQDLILYAAPDSYVVGIDARSGEMRWQSKVETRGNSSGPLVADGKVISGGSCGGNRNNCFISAHDALTGKELWRFYTTPAPGEPGDETWGGADVKNRQASTWGLPGTYDPVRKMLYWGVANPMPDQRSARHDGNPDAVSRTAPADLYSNSTIALNPDTGKLSWYYQHLPGDDWDSDYTHERTLVRTRVSPDPNYVKWINPTVRPGQEHDVVVAIGEAGGIFVLDRNDGKFLWATPFPADAPEFVISGIDVKTGKTSINWDNVFKKPGDRHIICFWNTRSYWPTAYSPVTNSLYTSYIDNCRDLTVGGTGARGGGLNVVPRPGSNPNELTGLAKIDLTTGKILRFDVGRAPGNGAMLATAGGLIFHGDMSQKFKAFDAETGKELWQTTIVGNISVSTITYAVKGKQYVAVMTGDNPKVPELSKEVPELNTPKHNAIYVFGLP